MLSPASLATESEALSDLCYGCVHSIFLFPLWGEYLRLCTFFPSHKSRIGAGSFSFLFPRAVPFMAEVGLPSLNPAGLAGFLHVLTGHL